MNYLRRAAVAMAAALALAASPAMAQSYPSQAIRFIIPSAPGGGYDVLGRQLAEKLSAELGQAIVVENRTGAGTVLGTQAAAQAPADGYTLLIGGLSNIVINHGLYERLPYKTVDFVPIAIIGNTSYTLMSRTDLPQATLKQIVDHARANPGTMTIGTAGVGTGQHIAAALLMAAANIKLTEVPYKGAQPVYTDLFGGRVDLFFDTTATAKPFIDAHKVKAIVTSSASRDDLIPNVPTGKEAGFDQLVLEGWLGLFAPSKTPKPVLDKLRASVANTMRNAELRKRLQTYGIRLVSMSPEETDKLIQSDLKKWPDFLRRAGIKAD